MGRTEAEKIEAGDKPLKLERRDTERLSKIRVVKHLDDSSSSSSDEDNEDADVEENVLTKDSRHQMIEKLIKETMMYVSPSAIPTLLPHLLLDDRLACWYNDAEDGSTLRAGGYYRGHKDGNIILSSFNYPAESQLMDITRKVKSMIWSIAKIRRLYISRETDTRISLKLGPSLKARATMRNKTAKRPASMTITSLDSDTTLSTSSSSPASAPVERRSLIFRFLKRSITNPDLPTTSSSSSASMEP